MAIALAMAGGVVLPQGKNFAISGNWGTFEGSNAASFGAIGRVSDNLFVTGGVGAGFEEGITLMPKDFVALRAIEQRC